MTTKQHSLRAHHGRKASAGTLPPRSHAAPHAKEAVKAVLPAIKLSFSVAPFVSIVERHVKVSEKARQAIARDLAEVLGHADVQLLAASEPQADAILTTEQAARLAGVSRPFMVKLIDAGAVALHQKVGNQRRVLRGAVLRWQQAERTRQAQSLKRLAQDLDEEIFSS